MPYKKDHTGWDMFSRNLENSAAVPFFKVREIWWISIGINVGHEEDGKGEQYSRPVLILKKFGKYTFIGIPLSTTKRVGNYYLHFIFQGKENTALLAQIRTFDYRRLINKEGTLDESIFQDIRKAIKDVL